MSANKTIHRSPETLSNSAMNQAKYSTIHQPMTIVDLPSKNRITQGFSERIRPIDRFPAKNKLINPQNRNPEQLNNENVISQSGIEVSFVLVYPPGIERQQRDGFSVYRFVHSIAFLQETNAQPHRTRIGDDWTVKTRNQNRKCIIA